MENLFLLVLLLDPFETDFTPGKQSIYLCIMKVYALILHIGNLFGFFHLENEPIL